MFGSDSCLAATGGIDNKKKAVIKFNTWFKNRKPLDIIVYTNGSQEIDQSGEPISSGAGWVLNCIGSWYSKQGIPLGRTNEIYDAEVIAILEGLKQVLKSPMARVAPGIYICLDNLGMARNAGYVPKSSSQKVFRQFKDLAEG